MVFAFVSDNVLLDCYCELMPFSLPEVSHPRASECDSSKIPLALPNITVLPAQTRCCLLVRTPARTSQPKYLSR